MNLRLLCLGMMGLTSAASAHDFWLQPQRWEARVGEQFGLTLQVGHGEARQRSAITEYRITRFEAIAPQGQRVDLQTRLTLGLPAADATVALERPGSWLVILETDNRASSYLPAARFNSYLEDEGLVVAIAQRAQTGRSQADGSETYSRHAKTIMQIGTGNPRQQTQIVRPAGLKLEIVPEINPLSAVPGESLPVLIYYHGKSLAGALIKLNNLDSDARPIATRRSDAHGRAIFPAPGKGSWQFNVVWTRPAPRDSTADFDTSFSSLSFGKLR